MDNDNRNFIGLKIKEIRETLGLTQEEFGAPLGVGANTISQYESLKVEPGSGFLDKLFIIYRINPKKFFDFENRIKNRELVI